MHNNNEDHGVAITEQATGEYPVLSIDDTIEQRSAERPERTDKAAFWLTHLETELDRLHAKWQSIDAEFTARAARIAELQKDVEAREAVIGRLTTDLRGETKALEAAGERLVGKDREIAVLVEDRQQRDERIAILATELADAEVAHKGALERIAQAEAEATRLKDTIRDEQAAAAAVGARNQELLAEQGRLRGQVQDLEIYINGRHDRWSALNSQLADYKNSLLQLEQTLKDRDAAFARNDEQKQQLDARILDLERQGVELATQLTRREEAYDGLQEKLSASFEQNERLKAEYAQRLSETEQAVKTAADAQSRIESLELGTKGRDESIEALKAEIERGAAALGELIAAKDGLVQRVDELEKGLAERSQQAEALREDLRMSHHQLQLAQQQLSDRTAQLASNQQALDQKSRHTERLSNDLSAMHKDAAGMRASIQKLETQAAELDRQRREAATEAEQLKLQAAAQQKRITLLETELLAKQATEDLLERSVGRITDLGASVAALDQRMSGGGGSPPAEQLASSLNDFAATLDGTDRMAAAAAAATEQTELLPIRALLDEHDGDDVFDIGCPTSTESGRKLIVSIGGEDFDYPIVSNVITIGRGRASDIRIASHFVSRVHAKVRTNEGATIIEDAGSKNGVLVNSERVRRRVLHDGDVVNIGGDFNLRFVDAMR
jgi:chromosome segregation ATPase